MSLKEIQLGFRELGYKKLSNRGRLEAPDGASIDGCDAALGG